MPFEELIGEVFLYDGRKSMAYLELYGNLMSGQTVHFKDPEGDFFEEVGDMHIANQTMDFCERGDFIGIHVAHTLHEHDKVFVSE